MTASAKQCVLTLLVFTLSFIGAFGQTPAPQRSNANEKNPPPIGKLIDVGGYRIHLYCVGAGSPTVLILGAGFSFDWGLVQPKVAELTQVCSYDHSGIAWSDSGPKDSCSLRIDEAHTALKNAGINGPYVLVGHSRGALLTRLYAERYPTDVAGIVFVDHEFHFDPKDLVIPPPQTTLSKSAKTERMVDGLESDPNFRKLSSRDRELHVWAVGEPRSEESLQATAEATLRCIADVEAITKSRPVPLGDKPLVDVSTDRGSTDARYAKLQAQLLSLSTNSKHLVAENSSHFVIIDRPDVVIDAIGQVVRAARSHSQLKH